MPFDPRAEKDACGIGFVADVEGRTSRFLVEAAIEGLSRVRHRGAVSADAKTGDGAGLLMPIPRRWLQAEVARMGLGEDLDASWLGLGMVFIGDSGDERVVADAVTEACRAEAIDVVGWREVPTEIGALGGRAHALMPRIRQAILLKPASETDAAAERRAHRARRRAERALVAAGRRVYFPSFSFRTVTYKALVAADLIASFYVDLQEDSFDAPFVMYHQRYSTNTTPSWTRAQPFRLLCHNGEINTIAGNVNRMRSREGRLGKWSLIDEEILRPIIDESGSDSAMLDNAIELMIREGLKAGESRDIRKVMAMMVPAAWEHSLDMPEQVRDFYRWQQSLMEPWDGPAGLIFTDGDRIGAALDRNGLRPLRYTLCDDGFLHVGSEIGTVNTQGHGSVKRGRLGPGEMVFLDPKDGGFQLDPIMRIVGDQDYGQWVSGFRTVQSGGEASIEIPDDLSVKHVLHGWTREEMNLLVRPVASTGKEPTFSMGDDTSLAVLSPFDRPVSNYLKQRFAQVTNPAIDHLRERHVMSLRTLLGPRDPLLWERPEGGALLEYETFLLFKAPGGMHIDATWPVSQGREGLERRLIEISEEAERAATTGAAILIITDEAAGPDRAPIPSLLAVGAINTALLEAGHRTRTSLVVSSDDIKDSHTAACLLGYGAEALHPRLALATVASLAESGRAKDVESPAAAMFNLRNAMEEGVLKILSKMGISTIDSYRGAQIFDAIGLGDEVIERCFGGTVSPIGGIGFPEIADHVLARHEDAYECDAPKLANPGFVKYQSSGEFHQTNPDVVRALHEHVDPGLEHLQSTKTGAKDQPVITPEMEEAHLLQRAIRSDPNWERYSAFSTMVNNREPSTIRDLLELVPERDPIPLAEVEPVGDILRRFSTGAISHGAISAEAHETLSIAMNRMGGKANTGEGGEDPERFRSERNSKIKQVASGRFGVTPQYLSFAEELQIKVAQGSKPGEGGQLPGHKATEEIARLRHTSPGVALISPPPHHDIYSIEDLAQLIFDLKQVNPRADVSVKLVSEVGVGTIAAGVVKGLADVVHISGADGGTGASPLISIKNAGMPWEIGLAEAQRTLVDNHLRERARLRVDGGFKTGRDVMIAALLGADEFSFGTMAMVAEGCIMVRSCHLDTCPVGIATQRPDLRAKFAGTPEMVVHYLMFVAEEVRRLLASMGLRSLDEAIGRTDLVRQRATSTTADLLELKPLLAPPQAERRFRHKLPMMRPTSKLGDVVAAEGYAAIKGGSRVEHEHEIKNDDRAIGARLGGAIGHEFGESDPPGVAVFRFKGEAGQSFGAFITDGIEMFLEGEANDYVGKGMGGGIISIRPPDDDAGDPVLVGNTCLYGATGGQMFVAGRAGERFAVRNSGAVAVIEGAGQHLAEYMTGGTVLVLGPAGQNIGAGMTGGTLFLLDPTGSVKAKVNPELVDVAPASIEERTRAHALVQRHFEETDSSLAAEILREPHHYLAMIWIVRPRSDAASISQKQEGTRSGKG